MSSAFPLGFSTWSPTKLLVATWLALVVITALVGAGETILLDRSKGFGGSAHDGYIELARNLSAGHGYVFEPGGASVFHRPPLYASLLVPAASTGSELAERWYVTILNAFALAATATLVFTVGRSLLGPRHGSIAYILLLCNPWLVHMVRNPMPAICQMALYFGFLFLCTIALVDRRSSPKRETLLWLLGLTLCSWMTLMSHGVMMLLVPFFLGSSAIYALVRLDVRTFRRIVIAAALVTLATAPWTIRNREVTGQTIVISGNAGLAYFVGNAHWGIDSPYSDKITIKQAMLNQLGIDGTVEDAMHFYGFREIGHELIANAAFKRHVREHPGRFAKKVLLNGIEYYFPAAFHWIGPTTNEPGVSDLARTLYFAVMLVLAARGIVRLLAIRSLRVHVLVLGAGWGLLAASYLPFLTYVGHSLYNFGTLPFVTLFAAAAFVDSAIAVES